MQLMCPGNRIGLQYLVQQSFDRRAGKRLEVTYVPKDALERTAALPRTPENFWNIFGAEVCLRMSGFPLCLQRH